MTLPDGPHGIGVEAAGDLVGTSQALTAVCFPTADFMISDERD